MCKLDEDAQGGQACRKFVGECPFYAEIRQGGVKNLRAKEGRGQDSWMWIYRVSGIVHILNMCGVVEVGAGICV